MLYSLSAKFFAAIMSLVIFFNGLSAFFPVFGDAKVDIAYTFSSAKAYSAAGTVTLSGDTDGEYELFWGTDGGKKLSVTRGEYEITYSEFAAVEVENGKGEAEIYSFTAIPAGAQSVLAYKGNAKAGEIDLPETKSGAGAAPVYSFGALSDLHFNRYNLSLCGDDAMLTFPNALNFLDLFDISIVGMSGDISNNGEENAFEKFNTVSSRYDFPVFTCTGNHDVSSLYTLENWQKYVNTGVYSADKKDGVLNVSDNGMDFVYSGSETHGDVFIFLSQYKWDYNNETSRILTDEQLDWLALQLEAHKDKTVYLFFHTFLANANGDKDTGEGNLKNSAGNTYDLVFTPGTPDEARFTALMKQYKNVVFFNGHSHWAFDMQKFNPIMNITDYNGEYATLVHISSVSSPRRTTAVSPATTEWNMRSSEGYLAAVYDDYIVLTGCDFLAGEMLAYAAFVIER